MRLAVLEARQAEATSEYGIEKRRRVRPGRSSVLHVARNLERDMRVEFTESSLLVARTSSAAQDSEETVEVELMRFGRAENLSDVKPPELPPRVSTSPLLDEQRDPIGTVNNRIEYPRGGGLTEWYLNGPAGVEQGFTLEERPAGSGQLTFDIAIEGEGVELVQSGSAIELRTSSEVVVGQYRELFALDATGDLLPATLRVVDGHARLSVDDSQATYPIVVDPTIWLTEAILRPQNVGLDVPDGSTDDRFGGEVALSGDTAVVSAGGHFDRGCAYVFVRGPSGWVAQQKILPAAGQEAGCSVAVSGDTLVLGSWDSTLSGMIRVFVRSGSTWSLQQQLRPTELSGASDAAPRDMFAASVSLSGDTLLAGSAGATDQGADSGAAYVFVRSGSTWTIQQKLLAALPDGTPDGSAGDRFSMTVALSGDTALIASLRDDDHGEDAGSAYVFVRSASTWSVEQKLWAALPNGTPDGGVEAEFGTSLALSGDTAIVGSPRDSDLGERSGSAYAFVREGGVWSVQQKLLAELPGGVPDGSMYDQFGQSVAVLGDVAVVGSTNDDAQGAFSGSAYVFSRNGGEWSVEQKLIATLPSGVPDGGITEEFGAAVAIADGTVIVGCPYDDHQAGWAGSAYVFARNETTWVTERKLLASVPNDGEVELDYDKFGSAVAIDGDTAVVGSSDATDQGWGTAYVFVRDGSGWSLQQKLWPVLSNGASDGGGEFGAAVAISGDTLIVGAPTGQVDDYPMGKAYVFVRTGTTWSMQQKLVATLPSGTPDGSMDDRFGGSVALSGDTVIIGSSGDDDWAESTGSAYVFVRSGSIWSVQQKILAARPNGTLDVSAHDLFGGSVALSGETALIGSRGDDDGGSSAGAAYVFVRAGSTWSAEQKLYAGLPAGTGDSSAGDAFGTSVALSDDTALVGSPDNDDQGASAGAAYVFARSGSIWTVQQKLLASTPGGTLSGAEADAFGASVALASEVAIVGSPWGDVPSGDSGSAFVFVRHNSAWTVDQHVFVDTEPSASGVGNAVAVSGRNAVIGAWYSGPSYAGAAYALRMYQTPGEACASNEDCVTGICTDDLCRTDLGDACGGVSGGLCTPDAFCVDGVCCASACTGVCEACNVDDLAGTCSPLPEGDTPVHGSCTAPSDPACGPGLCDGVDTTECKFAIGTPCGLAACSDSQISGQACDIDGACTVFVPPEACAGNLTCATEQSCRSECEENSDCLAAFHCTLASGSCEPDRDDGQVCALDGECSSTHCVDGVCCDSACSGSCQACDLAGQLGVCSVLPADEAPHGVRPSCDEGDHASCAARCDGVSTSCVFPSEDTRCEDESCSGDALISERFCDGTGSCAEGEEISCLPYACEAAGASCATSCEAEDACAAGFACESGTCRQVEPVCASDSVVRRPDGSEEACSPYLCDEGECSASCDEELACAVGFVCRNAICVSGPDDGGPEPSMGSGGTDPGSSPASGGTDSGNPDPEEMAASGCGCRVAGAPVPASGSALWALGLLAWGWARRSGGRNQWRARIAACFSTRVSGSSAT